MADVFNLTNPAIANNADIDSFKVEQVYQLVYGQTGTVVADTGYLGIVRTTAARIIDLEASITEAIATGADRTVTLDLQRSSGGGAFATILTATIVFNNGSTLRAIVTAAIANPVLADGDQLRLTVAVAGAAGAQAQGLNVGLTIRTDPQ